MLRRYPQRVRRGHPLIIIAAIAALVMVGLLDVISPSDVSFDELYLIPVVLVAWGYGWGAAVTIAAAACLTEFAADSSLFRPADAQEPVVILVWNGLSSFVAFAALGVATDLVFRERERWHQVNAERARLLRLLEREFPRPLRGIEWFANTFGEAFDRQAQPDALRERFRGLRHHTRELRFLATDLLSIGRVRSGDLAFEAQDFDVKTLVKQAADETVDRNRVLVRTTDEELHALGDPESVRHAVSAIIGRLIEASPSELVDVLVRGSSDEVAIELTSRGTRLASEDVELSDLLLTANRGRLVASDRGTVGRVIVYLPRSGALATAPDAAKTSVSKGS